MWELRQAARSLRRTPGFSAAVVVMLALGIGVNATLFSIADAVVLRPFAFADQDRLVIAGENTIAPRSEISYRDYLFWRRSARTFDDLAVMGSTNFTLHLVGAGSQPLLRHRAVSANFFAVLGVQPLMGRVFDAADDRRGAARTIVLGYGLWQRQFGGDAGVVGRVLSFSEGAFTVVGVMPRSFQYPAGAEAWTPVVADLAAVPPTDTFERLEDSNVGVLYALGRLRPAVTLDAARADLDRAIAARSLESGRRSRVASRVTPLVDDILGSTRRAMWMLMAAVSLLLLVACANVAGLLLVRAAARRREFAVRLALGATRGALGRHLLCESLLLASGAVITAAIMAAAALPIVRGWIPGDLPRLADAAITGRTLLFTAVAGVAAGLFSWTLNCGLWIADCGFSGFSGFRGWSTEPIQSAIRHPQSAMAWRRGLIVGELAAAVVLLTAAGLMLRSVAALSRLDLGFDPHGLMAITISTASSATTDERRALVDRALPELESIAGVTAAGAVSNRPLFGPVGNDSPVLLEGQTRDAGAANPFVNAMTVTPEYFHTLRARLAQGRFLTRDDRQATERVVVVSAGFAAWAWPDGRALGRRLQVAALGSGRPIWWRVVGVVEDSRNREIASPMFDIYAPFAQSPNAIDTLVVRTAADGAAVLSLIRQRLEPIATGGGVSIESMEDVVAAHEAPWRTNLALFGAFAVLTLIIAATGLYALVARSVLDRSREIGVRLALGATPARVARRVVSDAGRLVVSGALIGLGVAAGASRMLRSLLFGVQPLDPPALAAAPLLLAAIALTACLLPAVRAARTDPAICLRSE